MKHSILRDSIHSLADLAGHAPHLYQMVSTVGDQRRRQRTNRILRGAGWLGAGLVLGAGLTTILTPKTGAELRKALSDQATRVRHSLAPESSRTSRSNGAYRRVAEGTVLSS